MLLRRFTDFILQSRLQAMGAAFAISLIPLIGSSLSVLVAGLITLRKGAYEGTLVLCAGLAPYLMSYLIASPESSQAQMFFIATTAVVVINVFTWLYAIVLRRYGNWNLVIEIAMFSGIAMVAVVHLFYPDIQSWWSSLVTGYMNKTLNQLAIDGAVIPDDTRASLMATTAQFADYATGMLVASLLFNALLQLVLARWWQAVIFNPGGLRKELHQIRLSYLSAMIFVAAIGLAVIGNAFGFDVMPVIIAAFCAAGLSLIHRMLLPNKNSWFWLTLVYLGLIFLSQVGIVAVSILGLFDSLFDFRKQFGKLNNS